MTPSSSTTIARSPRKPNVVFLDDYQGLIDEATQFRNAFGQCHVTVYRDHVHDESQLVQRLQEADIICGMRERTPFPRSLLERLPQLKLLVTSGMHNASFDLEAAADLGITVSGTPAPPSPPNTVAGSNSTSELTWALILACARHLPTELNNVKQGRWQSTVGNTLAGSRLGLVGLGRLGQQMVPVAKAFGMTVIAWSENLTPERAKQVGVEFAPTLEALCQSSVQYLSIHTKLSSRTEGLIRKHHLKLLGPDAYLINTSRGPIVHEADLVDALQEGIIAGAGLDVYDIEPLPRDHLLRTIDNAICLPHIGYGTHEGYDAFFKGYNDAIQAYLDGQIIMEMTKQVRHRRTWAG